MDKLLPVIVDMIGLVPDLRSSHPALDPLALQPAAPVAQRDELLRLKKVEAHNARLDPVLGDGRRPARTRIRRGFNARAPHTCVAFVN